MGSPLTIGSDVECGHKGVVIVTSMAKLTVGGQAVLLAAGVAGSLVTPFTCTTPMPPGSTTKKCTSVASVLPISLAMKLTAGGAGVVLDTLTGQTDGVPIGQLLGVAKQTKLTAV